MSRAKTIIGIDPDVSASGFAKIEKHATGGSNIVQLQNLTFFELFEELARHRHDFFRPVVYVECGFLNRSNWHKVAAGSAAVNAAIGNKTGANHEVARKIVEMCQYFKLPYVEVKPTAHKIDAKAFAAITGIKTRTNQEQRDACMLVWGR